MILWESAGAAVNALSGAFLGALGLLVLRLKPRRRANLALALFSASFGLSFFVTNTRVLASEEVVRAVIDVLRVLAAAAVVYLAALLPTPLTRQDRPAVATAAVLSVVPTLAVESLPPGSGGGLSGEVTWFLLMSALWFAVFVFALRFARASGPAAVRVRPQAAFLSAALLAYLSVQWPPIPGTPWTEEHTVGFGRLLLLVGLWLWSTRVGGSHGRWARDLALLALGLPALAATSQAFMDVPIPGLGRTGMVLLLAYAILRHQLLGMDVKVKWTLKQSTVAAAFIGVFFVVSESASAFLAETGFGTYLGIAAAGMLVFAIAPLQRAAERVASAAMPGVKDVSQMSSSERLAVYLEQARIAWADGRLIDEERALLDGLRRNLGLSAEEVLQAEREAFAQSGQP